MSILAPRVLAQDQQPKKEWIHTESKDPMTDKAMDTFIFAGGRYLTAAPGRDAAPVLTLSCQDHRLVGVFVHTEGIVTTPGVFCSLCPPERRLYVYGRMRADDGKPFESGAQAINGGTSLSFLTIWQWLFSHKIVVEVASADKTSTQMEFDLPNDASLIQATCSRPSKKRK